MGNLAAGHDGRPWPMRPPKLDKRLVPLVLLLGLAWTAAPAAAAPVAASLTADPASPLVGDAVKLTATSTAANKDRPIVRYDWDLDGNGTFETTTGGSPTVTRSYPKPGVVV